MQKLTCDINKGLTGAEPLGEVEVVGVQEPAGLGRAGLGLLGETEGAVRGAREVGVGLGSL